MLKKFNLILLISIFSFICNQKSFAEDLIIVFVDMDKIIATSNAGKKIQSSMDKFAKKENQKFDSIESNLKKKEQEILKQKNILSKEELDNKIVKFKQEVQSFNNKKKKFDLDINNERLKSINKMVKILNEMLANYASENSIGLIIQKKNILIGKSELDITNDILNIFNNQVKSIN